MINTMTNMNEIKKRINDKKLDLIDGMAEADLKNYIRTISQAYYISYLNDEESNFNAAASILEYIKKESKHNNTSNYINYCMLIAINSLLNKLMDKKMQLIIPDVVDITAADNIATVNRLEIVKAKRKELQELKANNGTIYDIVDKQLELTDEDD